MFSIADLESEQPEFEEEAAEGEEEEPVGAIFPLRCSITVTKVNLLPFPVRHLFRTDVSLSAVRWGSPL